MGASYKMVLSTGNAPGSTAETGTRAARSGSPLGKKRLDVLHHIKGPAGPSQEQVEGIRQRPSASLGRRRHGLTCHETTYPSRAQQLCGAVESERDRGADASGTGPGGEERRGRRWGLVPDTVRSK
jgi:hypothetical protein